MVDRLSSNRLPAVGRPVSIWYPLTEEAARSAMYLPSLMPYAIDRTLGSVGQERVPLWQ